MNTFRTKICKERIKYSLILLLLFFSSVPISSQVHEKQNISIEANNEPIKTVFQKVSQNSEYKFFYDENLLKDIPIVKLSLSDVCISQLLAELKKQTGLHFDVEKNIVTVTRHSQIFQNVEQQTLSYSGVVMDKKGEPLIGVSIKIKNTLVGTITDLDGKFKIDAPEKSLLEISYMGYEMKEILLTRRRVLTIMLEEKSVLIDDVVITGFGLSQKKESLTGAISVISSDDISRSVAPTTSGALVGKIAGLNSRQTDGRPGATTTIQIRNMGTPLYVIDGMQSDEGQFNNLDFNDIESISVLKDATAAIYGVRAANGVIVVTTKKGRFNTKNTVSLNAYYGIQSISDFPRPANALTYITNYIQSETIQGKTPYTYNREDYEKWKQGTEKGYIPFDWYDYIFDKTPQSYVNLNITGGAEKMSYYFSLGHLEQDALMTDFGGFKRTNVQLNVNSNITNRLSLGVTINGRVETRKNVAVPEDDYWIPRYSVYRNLPTISPYANDNPEYPALVSTSPITNFAVYGYNTSGTFEEIWRVVQLQANTEYKVFDGLKAKALFGYFFAYQQMNNHEYSFDLYNYDAQTDTYPVVSTKAGMRERQTSQVEDLMTNIQLDYSKKFEQHSLDAIVGFEASRRRTPSSYLHSVPLLNDLSLVDFQTMDQYSDYGDNTQARLGWLIKINYDYAGKYLLEFSARYDGSWKFPPNHRWGFFPSGSIGWRISEEPFWKNHRIDNVVNHLKVRASYGVMGDDNLGNNYQPFDYMSGYNYYDGGATLDGEYIIGSAPRGLPITTLSWMKAKTFDVGFDISFLNNRLVGQWDYFRRKRTGIPAARYDVLIPSEAGFTLPLENLNSDLFKGYDFAVSWSDKINKVSYSVGASATYSRLYDWDQYKPRFGNAWDEYRYSAVHRYACLNWGYEAIGQFQSWEEIATYPINNDGQGNKTLRPGDIKYKDVNNDGIINEMDYRPIGYREQSTPIFNYGINFAFKWNGFDLAFDFTGASGYSLYQQYESRNPFHGAGNNPQYYMEDTWRLSDIWDANSELIPGKYPTLLLGTSDHSNMLNSSFWKYNVKYIKLRNLELGYTVPNNLISRLFLSECRAYISGTNLLTFSNLPEIDPEQSLDSGLGQPTTRVITIGINLKF